MIDQEKIKKSKYLRHLPEELREGIIEEVEQLSSLKDGKQPSESSETEVIKEIEKWAAHNSKKKEVNNGK
jgi:hypothetical protein